MTGSQALTDPVGLARRIAERTYPTASGSELDDLTQEAWLGIARAVDTFNSDRGRSLDSWAWLTARGTMARWWARVHHPRHGSCVLDAAPADGREPWAAQIAVADPDLGRVVDRVYLDELMTAAGLSCYQARVCRWVFVHGPTFGAGPEGVSNGHTTLAGARRRLQRVARGDPPQRTPGRVRPRGRPARPRVAAEAQPRRGTP